MVLCGISPGLGVDVLVEGGQSRGDLNKMATRAAITEHWCEEQEQLVVGRSRTGRNEKHSVMVALLGFTSGWTDGLGDRASERREMVLSMEQSQGGESI